jgi:hypothetical protein
MTHFGTCGSGPTHEVHLEQIATRRIEQNKGLCFFNESGEAIDTLNQSQVFFSKTPSVLQAGLVHPELQLNLNRQTTLHPSQYGRHHEATRERFAIVHNSMGLCHLFDHDPSFFASMCVDVACCDMYGYGGCIVVEG